MVYKFIFCAINKKRGRNYGNIYIGVTDDIRKREYQLNHPNGSLKNQKFKIKHFRLVRNPYKCKKIIAKKLWNYQISMNKYHYKCSLNRVIRTFDNNLERYEL